MIHPIVKSYSGYTNFYYDLVNVTIIEQVKIKKKKIRIILEPKFENVK